MGSGHCVAVDGLFFSRYVKIKRLNKKFANLKFFPLKNL